MLIAEAVFLEPIGGARLGSDFSLVLSRMLIPIMMSLPAACLFRTSLPRVTFSISFSLPFFLFFCVVTSTPRHGRLTEMAMMNPTDQMKDSQLASAEALQAMICSCWVLLFLFMCNSTGYLLVHGVPLVSSVLTLVRARRIFMMSSSTYRSCFFPKYHPISPTP